MKEVDIYAESETFSNDSFQDDGEAAEAAEAADASAVDEPFDSSTPGVPAATAAQSGGKHHKSAEPIVVIKKEEKYESEPEPSEDDVSSESGSSDSGSSSDSTVDCLSRDPLFLVLSQYLSNSEGNIVDVLCKINRNLKRIAKALKQ